MPPKEKATELYSKFQEIAANKMQAKELMLLTVDEIIDSLDAPVSEHPDDDHSIGPLWHRWVTGSKNYWKEVSTEIQKLEV
jgi:hypothetical protein